MPIFIEVWGICPRPLENHEGGGDFSFLSSPALAASTTIQFLEFDLRAVRHGDWGPLLHREDLRDAALHRVHLEQIALQVHRLNLPAKGLAAWSSRDLAQRGHPGPAFVLRIG
jgi:hypothetical protein